MSSRVPPLLEPYLALPPEGSLTLLTSVLGASSNWLVQQFLCAALRGGGADTGVVLVSFLRDGAFWRDGAGKMGVDLGAMGRAGRFVFVDGLTGMGMGSADGGGEKGLRVLRDFDLGHVRAEVEAAIADLRPSRRILIVDQPDALLATSSDEDITSLFLQNTLLSLRERVHATVLTLSSDAPLLHTQTTTLERQHAALVLSQAHAADRVLALRVLDTGSARDVSGVVRITTGSGEGVAEVMQGEYLYFVAGDGSVRVFERGA